MTLFFTRVLNLFELYALSKWKLLGKVNCACTSSHVLFPGVRSSFSAPACRLVPPESATDLGPIGWAVNVNDASVSTVRSEPLE